MPALHPTKQSKNTGKQITAKNCLKQSFGRIFMVKNYFPLDGSCSEIGKICHYSMDK